MGDRHQMIHRTIRAGIAGLAVIATLAACGNSAATSTPIPTAPAAAASSAPTAAASLPPAPTSSGAPVVGLPSGIPSFALPSGGSFAIPSFTIPSFALPSGDKALEARLPDSINGVTFQKYSIAGPDFLNDPSSPGASDLNAALTALGKSPSDVGVAVAADPSGQIDLTLGAFQIVGTDSGALINAFVNATKNETPGAVVTTASVGGKNVTEITNPEQADQGPIAIYANGDTLFFAQSADPALLATGIAALP